MLLGDILRVTRKNIIKSYLLKDAYFSQFLLVGLGTDVSLSFQVGCANKVCLIFITLCRSSTENSIYGTGFLCET